MADNRTMAQMLQVPIEGYEDAIVIPQINANNFKLKQTLINLDFVSVLMTDSQSYINWIPSTTHSIRMIRMHLIQQPEEISWIRFPANVYRSSKASQKSDIQGAESQM
uniref:Reverse transcriptase domain-containing protein n=1 Tax=Tanacetum cinerariifolium TaxID=118510 RepID=A0A699QW06_TANCI|nr:hypothetical protein [Tanacetum cinerariifolium]